MISGEESYQLEKAFEKVKNAANLLKIVVICAISFFSIGWILSLIYIGFMQLISDSSLVALLIYILVYGGAVIGILLCLLKIINHSIKESSPFSKKQSSLLKLISIFLFF